jgi:hypothetical protein
MLKLTLSSATEKFHKRFSIGICCFRQALLYYKYETQSLIKVSNKYDKEQNIYNEV